MMLTVPGALAAAVDGSASFATSSFDPFRREGELVGLHADRDFFDEIAVGVVEDDHAVLCRVDILNRDRDDAILDRDGIHLAVANEAAERDLADLGGVRRVRQADDVDAVAGGVGDEGAVRLGSNETDSAPPD